MLIRVTVPTKNTSGCCIMANRIHAAEVCDARDDDSSNAVEPKITIAIKRPYSPPAGGLGFLFLVFCIDYNFLTIEGFAERKAKYPVGDMWAAIRIIKTGKTMGIISKKA